MSVLMVSGVPFLAILSGEQRKSQESKGACYCSISTLKKCTTYVHECAIFFLSSFKKRNLTYLTTDVMFSGQHFTILAKKNYIFLEVAWFVQFFCFVLRLLDFFPCDSPRGAKEVPGEQSRLPSFHQCPDKMYHLCTSMCHLFFSVP